MGKRLDVVGQKFGRLTALSSVRLPNGRWGCACACDCGSNCTVDQGNLRRGSTTSCGCHKKSVLGISTTTHGSWGSRAYISWRSMRTRCNNPNSPAFPRYGGRGITISARWDAFQGFFADMGECPEGKSLDRIDTNGNYEPGNCRWATPKEQARNMRVNRMLTCNGVTACMSEWAEKLGISPSTLHERLTKKSVDEALTTHEVAPHGETIFYEVTE